MTCAFASCMDVDFAFGGWLNERLEANLNNWLLTAPYANPGMIEKLRMREHSNQDELMMWYGEFIGKYLTAAAACEKAMPSAPLRELVRKILAILRGVQGQDGYLGPFCRALRMVGAQDRRVWDVWGHYHLIIGLMAWHELYAWAEPFEMAVRIADYFCAYFLDGEADILEADWSEMNTAMLHAMGILYQKTKKDAYRKFMAMIEAAFDDPRAGGYITDTLAGKAFYQLRKPRWESLHPIQGILGLYQITGEERYREAFTQIWHSIRAHDVHNTGGFSSGEQACGNPYDPGAIETCCSVAWSALSVDMLRLTGDAKVADELERTLYNAIFGAQSPSGRWFTYNTPMDGERKASAHEIVFQAIAGSPELNCCSVNGPRALGMVSEWAIMHGENATVLNYLGAARYAFANQSALLVETDYPLETTIRISAQGDIAEDLWIRIPGWSAHSVLVGEDGRMIHPEAGQYVVLRGGLKNGDQLKLTLDDRIRREDGENECEGKHCLYRGPLLLAADENHGSGFIEDKVLSDKVVQDASRMKEEQVKRLICPKLLVKIKYTNGDECLLTDFASAGMQGGRYRTWLR